MENTPFYHKITVPFTAAEDLAKIGRPTLKEIVFHGTPQRNIQRYQFTIAILIKPPH
jgi:hypothetical protein